MMDQNRVQLALSAQKAKASAPNADFAEQKKAAQKTGNQNDFSAHMKEKLAADVKKAPAKNVQGNAPVENKKTHANGKAADLKQNAASESKKEKINQEDSVQKASLSAVDDAYLALELEAQLTEHADELGGNNVPLEFLAISQGSENDTDIKSSDEEPAFAVDEELAFAADEELAFAADEELAFAADEELWLVTEQIGLAGSLSPEQKLSQAELAGQAVGAKSGAAQAPQNALLPALQSLQLVKASPELDEAQESAEILELEPLSSFELGADTAKPQDFAASLRASFAAQPAPPLANMQAAEVSAPLHFDPQQQAQAAEELSERINLMLSKNLKQVDIR
ncbi:MAG: hypothetical protein ACRC9R_00480, partial [Enterovibrio sp.]